MTQPRLLGGRYELDGVVGRGGMAEVFRARDIRLDRVVAVKTLREDLARDQTFQARFRREAQSAASLNHPSIVAVYDTGEDMTEPSHVPYIVMEYVDGRTLRDLLRDDRRLLPERALEITDGVLRALDYSHRAGIVHRDIKPGNVMLTRNGEVKVMDFGIARAVSDAQATMTQTAQVIGTAQYLSPEQARGERVDARSDLYSTGCLLYELLTGRPPFLGDSPVAIAYQHVRENPVPPSRLDPEIPAWADSIVLRAMVKDPAGRYQSATEMRTDIQRALSGVPVAAPTGYAATQRMGAGAATTGGPTRGIPGYQYGPEEDRYRGGGGGRRTWIWWAAGALVLLAVLGIVAYAFFGGGGGGTAIPLVKGLPVAQAQSQITKAGLTPKVVNQASTTVTKGIVISTSPARREQGGGGDGGHDHRLQRAREGQGAQRRWPVVNRRPERPAAVQRQTESRSDVLQATGHCGQAGSGGRHDAASGQHGHHLRVRWSAGSRCPRQPRGHGEADPPERRVQRPGGDSERAARHPARHGVQPEPLAWGERARGINGDHLRTAQRADPVAHPVHPDSDRDQPDAEPNLTGPRAGAGEGPHRSGATTRVLMC